MSNLTAAGGDSSDSVSSSWPSMQRPPADSDCIESVPAIMNYVSAETTEISTRRDLSGSDDALVGAIWNPTMVRVANARLLNDEDRMNLDENGFELWSDENVNPVQNIDFCNQARVLKEYYPMCERLVAQVLSSQKSSNTSIASTPPPSIALVCAFDHNLRSSDQASVGRITTAKHNLVAHEEKQGEGTAAPIMPQVQQPAGIVHADYTKISAPRRLRDLSMPPKLNDVLRLKLHAEGRTSLIDPILVNEALEGRRRYAFINVWRSIDSENAVKNPPLACINAASTSVEDLRTFKIYYTDRIGENYFVVGPPASSSATTSLNGRHHAWFYYPDMTIREGLLLKQWDSLGGFACDGQGDNAECNNGGKLDGGGLSTFTIHSAFIDPTCSTESPPRKSIEVRCVAVYGKENQGN